MPPRSRVLEKMGYGRMLTAEPAPQPTAPAPEPQRPAQTYQSRAIEIEADPEPAETDQEDETEISPRTGKPKRRYKTRDLRAED